MNRLLVTLTVASSLFAATFTPSNGFADSCTGASADTLLACAQVGLQSCRISTGCTGNRVVSITSQDVVNDTAKLCCAKNGNKRKYCLNATADKLILAYSHSPASLRPFIRESRRRVLALRSNGCSTGSLGNL